MRGFILFILGGLFWEVIIIYGDEMCLYVIVFYKVVIINNIKRV